MASSKRAQSIVSVGYRCTECGALFGDPERKPAFDVWVADVVNHWIGRHGASKFMGGLPINAFMHPVYVWV